LPEHLGVAWVSRTNGSPCSESLTGVPHTAPKTSPRRRSAQRKLHSLTPEEADRLVAKAQELAHPYEAMIRLGLARGLRPGELTGLTREDVDFEERTVFVRRARIDENGTLRHGEPKTKKSERLLKVPSEVIDALRRRRVQWEQERAEAGAAWQDLVFCTQTGGSIDRSNLRRHFERLVPLGFSGSYQRVKLYVREARERICPARVDLHRLRWAMRCGARGQAETILGSEALSRGASPEGIPPGRDYAGVGYLVRDDGVIARCRSFWVSDESIVQHLELCQRRHRQALRNGHSARYRETSDPPDSARNANPTATLPPPVQMSLPLEPTPLQTAPRRRRRSRTSRPTDSLQCVQLPLPLEEAAGQLVP